ncbi:MAG: pallilysin-related adhesin [Treponema sp.]|jgi:flagellar motor protein MotB|nr:pallilysin-related adhesin [Treponema sp.]
MNVRFFRVLTLLVFLLSAVGIWRLIVAARNAELVQSEQGYTRIITPEKPAIETVGTSMVSDTILVPLNPGEVLVSVLTQDFDPEIPGAEQLLLYRNAEPNSPLYLSYLAQDAHTYQRLWTKETGITRPWTAALDVKDLIGDHSLSVVLSGMNDSGERILTVFKHSQGAELFVSIADIQTTGSIAIQETARTQTYQRGARGASFPLLVYENLNMANPLDQVEMVYTYNSTLGRYEQSELIQILGSQVEQRTIQTALNGGSRSFEAFIEGLWYFVDSTGTVNTSQYIYFDPVGRELVFYGDEAQQVFTWQSSSMTRGGLSIAGYNISVTTLGRSVDIELSSIRRIKVTVVEDVNLKIGSDKIWDGFYEKLSDVAAAGSVNVPTVSYIEAEYNGSMGKLRFSPSGSYELSSSAIGRIGKYVFFDFNGETLLEFRSSDGVRELYLVEHGETLRENGSWEALTLTPVRIGLRGIQRLRETPISLTESSGIEEEPVEEEVPAIVEDLPAPVLGFRTYPAYFSPDNDGVDDELTMFLNAQAASPIVSWSLEIREPQSPFQLFYRFGGIGAPPSRLTWNGKSSRGELVQAASDYTVIFTAEDSEGRTSSVNGTIGVDVLVVREEGGLRLQVPSIIFRGDYADFVGLAQDTVENNNRVLRRVAEILAKFPDYHVQVEGHANRSSLTSDGIELTTLSEARAKAVLDMLVSFGISRNRLSAVGMGGRKPVAEFGDVDNYWKNRRVEFLLVR